ncbi:MAG: WD40/YVTN/BNR-like repeat-containing protein [Gemmataceae bacterium]
MIPHALLVGCIGEGVFRSIDDGQTFVRAMEGVSFVECDVRAMQVDANDPSRVLIGTEIGLWESRDGANTWSALPGPWEGRRLWSLLLQGSRILAGTSPAAIFRSEDGGKSWQPSAAKMIPDCPRIRHTRVTTLLADPHDPDHLWAGVEIDGVHESRNGGRTWTRIGEGLLSQDIHALALTSTDKGSPRLLATTNRDLHDSLDSGQTWRPCQIDQVVPWNYTRGMMRSIDRPEVMFVGAGNGPPGSAGAVVRSCDGGRTWQGWNLPWANSTIWNFAVHSADPRMIYASSVSGQLFRTLDGGDSWSKLDREFGEIRGLAWAPR